MIRSEELMHKRAATMARIFSFLQVDASWTDPVLDKEFNETLKKRRDRPITRAVKDTNIYRRASGRVSSNKKDALRKATYRLRTTRTSRDLSHVQIPDEVRHRIEHVLRPDIGRLRSLLGESFDGWGIG